MNALFIEGGKAEDLLGSARFAALPLGSVEYHGPRAHLGTDTFLAEHFAGFLNEEYDCVVYPSVAFSPLPGKTAAYPGSVSVTPEVYISYLCDILSGILSGGQKNILILNAHDGNIGPARTAAEYVSGRFSGVNILIVNWWQLTDAGWVEESCGFADGGRGHGGAFELSAEMLACGVPATATGAKNRPPVTLGAVRPHTWIQTAPANWDGYIGSPGEASVESGEKIIAMSQKNLCELIDPWLQKSARSDPERNER